MSTVPKLLTTFIRPILEYSAPAYFSVTKGESQSLEQVQKLATRMIPELRNCTYEERCEKLDLFTLEYRRTPGDLIMVFKIVCLQLHPELQHLFVRNSDTRTRGHDFKLTQPQCNRLSQVYRFSTQIISIWNHLPEAIVSSRSVRLFKLQLDDHLWFKSSIWSSAAIPGAPYPRTIAAYG